MESKTWAIWSLGISVVALLFSIAVLVIYCPTCDVKADYMGVIVGVLALLVTTLIGYNIYNVIEINSRFHSMEDKVNSSINGMLENAVHYSSCYGLLSNATTMLRNGQIDRGIESLFNLLDEALMLKWPEGTSIIPIIVTLLTKHLGEKPESMSHIKTRNLKHFEVILRNTGLAEALELADRLKAIE